MRRCSYCLADDRWPMADDRWPQEVNNIVPHYHQQFSMEPQRRPEERRGDAKIVVSYKWQ